GTGGDDPGTGDPRVEDQPQARGRALGADPPVEGGHQVEAAGEGAGQRADLREVAQPRRPPPQFVLLHGTAPDDGQGGVTGAYRDRLVVVPVADQPGPARGM